MAKKTARVYTLDELKEKSRKALDDPKLIEITKLAPLNKDGKVNCTWVYKEAEKYVHEQTKDLQKSKELAVAARFLAMLRRDFIEELEKLLSESTKKETKPQLDFFDVEFPLPASQAKIKHSDDEIFIIFKNHGSCLSPKILFKFGGLTLSDTIIFCKVVLSELYKSKILIQDKHARDLLKYHMIDLLENEEGLKVKVCGNCCYLVDKYRQFDCVPRCSIAESPNNAEVDPWVHTCEHWTTGRVPDEPSSA